jgi:hypothetical protein
MKDVKVSLWVLMVYARTTYNLHAENITAAKREREALGDVSCAERDEY